jgi:hypothetical protein
MMVPARVSYWMGFILQNLFIDIKFYIEKNN